ncbi:hypothetical protein LUZ61_013314 [Rhynchospora tenuis]|uniref:WRKY domain-containing protein n=1 Tax=Rhynchospora tenuis TaxID=198213 RepID=A0AAD5W960_9POAL|nr:hypothetical protein LUZ61_013314 [Rhynchospora tenuis]
MDEESGEVGIVSGMDEINFSEVNMGIVSGMDEVMEQQQDGFVPRLGMEYITMEEAWSAWSYYGGKIGFGVRKGRDTRSRTDDAIISKTYVCSCEGKRVVDKREHLIKNPRAETRTGCEARLQIKLDRKTQKYKVVDFVSEHNHPLQPPEACYLIPSQRKVPEIASYDIKMAASSGIIPKDAHELLSRQNGGIRGMGYTKVDHDNCLRTIRKESMQYGAAIAMMKYFEKRCMEDESFKHFEDISEEGEISNVLWMDAKMIASYARFGDVVIFDTTFGTNNEKWALAHGGKKFMTIFTDQDAAIGNGLEKIMPETKHALCIWHIAQNCSRKLGSRNKEDEKISGDFYECVHRYEEEKEFEEAFKILMGKFDDGTEGYRFMEQFDRVLEQNREKEIKSEYEMRRKLPRIRFKMPILCGAANLYTSNVLELFPAEVELSMSASIECIEGNTYTVGILCWHALKVLDREDIKVIPPRYVLNRWTKTARDDTVVDIEGRRVIEDPMLDVRNRKADMLYMEIESTNLSEASILLHLIKSPVQYNGSIQLNNNNF